MPLKRDGERSMVAVQYHYGQFPPSTLEWAGLIPLIGPASAALARYDGVLSAIPNAGVLLSPLTTQEAVVSSRIEGTQATMGEVLEFDAGSDTASPQRRNDIQEISRYRAAMRRAEQLLDDLPLSQRVVREAHEVLMSGVRGQNRAPGEYRRVPNWIGPEGCSIEEAHFVPVSADKLPAAMGDWERFIHAAAQDKLVQAGLLHAEFEALHPFLDGNGRVGRMLIPLSLWKFGLIQRPMFYISAYFESRRASYYERLQAVSRDGDWTGWCRFFLDAIRVQAEANLERASGVLQLYESMKLRLPELTHSQYAIRALDWMFERPIFSSSDFVAAAGIPAPTARRLLRVLQEGEVLRALRPGRGRRAAILSFPELLNVAEGQTVF